MKRIANIILVSLLVLVMIFSGSGCGAKMKNAAVDPNASWHNSSDGAYGEAEEDDMDYAPSEPGYDFKDYNGDGVSDELGFGDYPTESQVSANSLEDRKIIKNGYISLETPSFDKTVDTIVGKISTVGGYVQSSRIRGSSSNMNKNKKQLRSAHLELRIPSRQFEQVIIDIGNLGQAVNKETSGDDITGKYFDTEARVATLKIQEERLLTILEKAEKLQDIIELERELMRIRLEIENLTGTLNKWDNMVQYSNLIVDVYEINEDEVEPEDPVTFWDRISKSFTDSLKAVKSFLANTVVFIVGASPYLVLIGIVAGAAFWIYGSVKKRRRKFKNKSDGN